MASVIVIPARYPSVRFPGKPLVGLRGATGEVKSLVQRSWESACAVPGVAAVWIATDDERIRAAAEGFGAQVVMTSSDCRNGTERVAEAVARAGISAEIIVNLQGDAPLTPPHFVTDLIKAMRAEPDCRIATPCLRCDAETLENLLADRRAGRVGGTTVVCDRLGRALYFSKEVLPFTNGRAVVAGVVPVFHHVGLYAYRRAALAEYLRWAPGPLEVLEGLEQLRFLENGCPVRAVEVTAAPGSVFWELNNPSDVPLIESYLARTGQD